MLMYGYADDRTPENFMGGDKVETKDYWHLCYRL